MTPITVTTIRMLQQAVVKRFTIRCLYYKNQTHSFTEDLLHSKSCTFDLLTVDSCSVQPFTTYEQIHLTVSVFQWHAQTECVMLPQKLIDLYSFFISSLFIQVSLIKREGLIFSSAIMSSFKGQY